MRSNGMIYKRCTYVFSCMLYTTNSNRSLWRGTVQHCLILLNIVKFVAFIHQKKLIDYVLANYVYFNFLFLIWKYYLYENVLIQVNTITFKFMPAVLCLNRTLNCIHSTQRFEIAFEMSTKYTQSQRITFCHDVELIIWWLSTYNSTSFSCIAATQSVFSL